MSKRGFDVARLAEQARTRQVGWGLFSIRERVTLLAAGPRRENGSIGAVGRATGGVSSYWTQSDRPDLPALRRFEFSWLTITPG